MMYVAGASRAGQKLPSQNSCLKKSDEGCAFESGASIWSFRSIDESPTWFGHSRLCNFSVFCVNFDKIWNICAIRARQYEDVKAWNLDVHIMIDFKLEWRIILSVQFFVEFPSCRRINILPGRRIIIRKEFRTHFLLENHCPRCPRNLVRPRQVSRELRLCGQVENI